MQGAVLGTHVFILSRIREGHDRGLTTEEAVGHGIRATASVVTSAAIVMVAVFAVFATLRMLQFKEMGVGSRTRGAIDATVVRAVLLPTTMTLLGDRNWFLPRWLEWLPQTTLEVAVDTPPPRDSEPAAAIEPAEPLPERPRAPAHV